MTIEAMKQALEALECIFASTHPYRGDESTFTDEASVLGDKAITSLRQAIEQAEKLEPVAWCVTYNGELTGNVFENKRIADLCKRNLEAKYGSEEDRKVVAIYAAPQPQHEWVGLTDEEVDYIADEYSTLQGAIRAIEAKLRSKNT